MKTFVQTLLAKGSLAIALKMLSRARKFCRQSG